MGARETAKLMQDQQRELDGAPIRTRHSSDAYRDGWERTFAPKPRCPFCKEELSEPEKHACAADIRKVEYNL
jgi:hypothetical protein